MSIRLNILANYVSQIYVMLIGIVMVPIYIKYMGVEAYGLVGFFTMLQGWFQLLDMGLTPTLSREVARFRGNAINALTLRRLMRMLEIIFFVIASFASASIVLSAAKIASEWLKVRSLSSQEVIQSLNLMAGIIALRWIAGLYRSAISGFENQVWLSKINGLIATIRFVFVIPLLILFSSKPTTFFSYQLIVAIIEVLVVLKKTYSLLPDLQKVQKINVSWTPIKDILKFSLTIAFTGAVWVIVTQTDKLILSKMLALEDYGYFTLAILIAGGINLIGGPISQALLPRLSKLAAEGKDDELIMLYQQATQGICIITVPLVLLLALFPTEILLAWTGSLKISQAAATILSLYALGNGFLVFSAFPYYLQYAKGELKLHLIGSFLFIVVLIPFILFETSKYGAYGAAWVWLIINFLYFLCWAPIVHKKFIPGKHPQWIKSIALAIFPGIIVSLCIKIFFVLSFSSRFLMAFELTIIGLCIFLINIIFIPNYRSIIMNFIIKLKR